ncbi:hypothetical protein STEG23_023935 [Scotinomys teguina]
MTLKAQAEYPVYLYRPKSYFDITAAVVAAIAVSTTDATAAGIAVSQNVQTVITVNKLPERVSSALDLQNQVNGHLHFELLTLNQQMVLEQEQMDILWAQQHVQCAHSFSSVCIKRLNAYIAGPWNVTFMNLTTQAMHDIAEINAILAVIVTDGKWWD